MDLVVKNRDGIPITHAVTGNVVGLRTPDGEIKDFVPADNVPVPVETTVELDFSGGNMAVTPAEGQLFSCVNIPVPPNLIPGNIPEGVTIAGIPGALASNAEGGKPNFFVKKVTIYSPAHNVHSGIITLATAEELAAAGFTGEKPAIIGFLPVTASSVYTPNTNPCTMGAIMTTLTLGVTSGYAYCRGLVFRGCIIGNRYSWEHTFATENAFSGNPVDNVPYYAGGEIRYNWDSKNPITDRGMSDTTKSTREIWVFAGTLKPTI